MKKVFLALLVSISCHAGINRGLAVKIKAGDCHQSYEEIVVLIKGTYGDLNLIQFKENQNFILKFQFIETRYNGIKVYYLTYDYAKYIETKSVAGRYGEYYDYAVYNKDSSYIHIYDNGRTISLDKGSSFVCSENRGIFLNNGDEND